MINFMDTFFCSIFTSFTVLISFYEEQGYSKAIAYIWSITKLFNEMNCNNCSKYCCHLIEFCSE